MNIDVESSLFCGNHRFPVREIFTMRLTEEDLHKQSLHKALNDLKITDFNIEDKEYNRVDIVNYLGRNGYRIFKNRFGELK